MVNQNQHTRYITQIINEIFYEYRIKNALSRSEYSITLYPEDFKEGASEKFKIEDIVKLKESAELDPFDSKNKNRLYVVRYLPRKFNGEKYFKTKKKPYQQLILVRFFYIKLLW